jgi:chemotaxis response regulator CheB
LASTRILVVALPRMLEEIVTDILRAQRGMEIAGTIRKVDGLTRKVARTRPDVVVIGGDDAPLAAALLEQSPRLKVLAVAEEGKDWWLYSLTAERTRLGSLSSATLVRAVESAVKPRPTSAWWS